MQLHFDAVSESSQAGPKWQKLFNSYWPAYRVWFNSKGSSRIPDLKTSKAALKYYMPEMLPTYEHLCQLVDADDDAARFLTGFQPPAYINACSQAVHTKGSIQMVRNYDYHPDLLEGTLLLSAWNDKKVMANIDCLIGVLDGMNEDGLAISLTFGGRKNVGKGFGIPFILRYILEFCRDVGEAVEALKRIPSHMSYNVTVIDKSGSFKTVMLAPDRAPIITNADFTTNHQGRVEWPENAQFNNTVERAEFLATMKASNASADELSDAFLRAPLYNTRFAEGIGTLYTAVYRPTESSMHMRWRNDNMVQTFTGFREMYKLIKFNEPATTVQVPPETVSRPSPLIHKNVVAKIDDHEVMVETLDHDLVEPRSQKEVRQKTKQKPSIHRKPTSWEMIADYWTNLGRSYWEKWRK